jgi:hypothetical protein
LTAWTKQLTLINKNHYDNKFKNVINNINKLSEKLDEMLDIYNEDQLNCCIPILENFHL